MTTTAVSAPEPVPIAPQASVDLNLEQLRLLAKSISRSMDAALKQLGRLKEGTHVHREVSADYAVLDSIEQEVRHAIETIVG